MGTVYGNLKEYQKAIEYFKKSMELDSTDIDNYRWMGLTYRFLGDSVNYKLYSDKAMRMQSNNQ